MLENVPLQVRQRLWFQHDGAPAHFALDVRIPEQCFPQSLDWKGWSSTVANKFSRSHSYGFLHLEGEMKILVYETLIDTPEELVSRVAEAAAIIFETVIYTQMPAVH